MQASSVCIIYFHYDNAVWGSHANAIHCNYEAYAWTTKSKRKTALSQNAFILCIGCVVVVYTLLVIDEAPFKNSFFPTCVVNERANVTLFTLEWIINFHIIIFSFLPIPFFSRGLFHILQYCMYLDVDQTCFSLCFLCACKCKLCDRLVGYRKW